MLTETHSNFMLLPLPAFAQPFIGGQMITWLKRVDIDLVVNICCQHLTTQVSVSEKECPEWQHIYIIIKSVAALTPYRNCHIRVLACYYSNTLNISRTLSPSLESIPSLFLCGNRKMRPPPQVQLDFDFSLLLLLTGDVSLNPGPSGHGLRLGTVNACSTWDKVPVLSDLVTSKGIDLLGITETWLTTKETYTDLAEMTPQGFSFHETRARRRGGGVGLFVSSAHKFSTISLPPPPKQVLRLYSANLNVVRHALLSSISIAHLVLLLLSSACYKISCPAYLHSLMIWL